MVVTLNKGDSYLYSHPRDEEPEGLTSRLLGFTNNTAERHDRPRRGKKKKRKKEKKKLVHTFGSDSILPVSPVPKIHSDTKYGFKIFIRLKVDRINEHATL